MLFLISPLAGIQCFTKFLQNFYKMFYKMFYKIFTKFLQKEYIKSHFQNLKNVLHLHKGSAAPTTVTTPSPVSEKYNILGQFS
jgi:hypothetical protein